MTNIYTRGAVIAAVLMSLAFPAQQASAASASFPKHAYMYTTWFARAMDNCDLVTSPSVVSVTSPGLPAFGCLQSNTATDNTLTLNWAELFVNHRGRIALLATGLPFGARVKLRMTVRVSRNNQATTTGTQKVTFEDATVTCPNSTFGFPANANGVVAQSTSLAACLGPGLLGEAIAPSNVEILGTELINADNSLPFAEPGIVR